MRSLGPQTVVGFALGLTACAWAGASAARLNPDAAQVQLFYALDKERFADQLAEVSDRHACAQIRTISVQDGFYRTTGLHNVPGSVDGAIIRVRNAAYQARGNAVVISEIICHTLTDHPGLGGPECNVRGVILSCRQL